MSYIYIHSKDGSHIVEAGSQEMHDLLNTGRWFINRSDANEAVAVEDMDTEELRGMAKEAGVKGAHNAKRETLIKKLKGE